MLEFMLYSTNIKVNKKKIKILCFKCVSSFCKNVRKDLVRVKTIYYPFIEDPFIPFIQNLVIVEIDKNN